MDLKEALALKEMHDRHAKSMQVRMDRIQECTSAIKETISDAQKLRKTYTQLKTFMEIINQSK